MDKDLDRSLIPNGNYRHAENLRFHINDGRDGIATNIKGSLLVSDVVSNQVFKCVSAYFDEDKNVVYYFLASPNRVSSKIVEYNIITAVTTVIIEDNQSILRFNHNGYITGVNEINGLLLFSEWTNNPRRVNIERAKQYGLNGFTEDDIMVAVIPPHQKLRISLQDTIGTNGQENYIAEKMISFSFRFKYLDDEYSALAPFTNFAFEPKAFDYNYAEQSNQSMVNKFNQVKIDFFTGNERVVEIQLIFKESENNSEWIIDDFNKAQLDYQNNTIETFLFDNSKVYRALPDNVLRSYFDNVPREVKAQTIIEGRLLYANYKEQYDLKNILGNDIAMDYKLILESLDNTIDVLEDELDADGNTTGNQRTVQQPSLVPKRTAKSNRGLQVGIVYLDEHGRSTTVLVSKTNTLFVPVSASTKENRIKVELNHEPPYWAKYYRFFITQDQKQYDQVLPTLFFQEGVFRYIRIEQSDIDKFKKGDYIIVKADGSGILETLQKIKILEFERKNKDFLSDENGGQPSGWYMKISTIGSDVVFDETNYTFLENKHYNETGSDGSPFMITNNELDFFEINYNGIGTGSLTPTVTFTAGEDLRYYIEITDIISVPNQFRWQSQETNGNTSNWTTLDTSTSNVVLDADVSVSFASTDLNTLTDRWLIKKNIGFITNGRNRSYAIMPVLTEITAGTTITLKYFSAREQSPASQSFSITQTANRNYRNFEEWFYGDEIYSLIELSPGFNFTNQKIWIRKGNVSNFNPQNSRAFNNISISETGTTYTLIIESEGEKNQTREIYSDVFTEVRKLENLPIFETEGTDQVPNIYYEIGKTYQIQSNNHSHITSEYETDISNTLGDISQSFPLQPLTVTLDWFSAWSYGNGVESYKIRDEFNQVGLDVGIRTLSTIKEAYKEITRIADITWSDLYNDDSSFNGLNWFNLSNANFILLDIENGSIQRIDNDNGNLLCLQESAIGTLPYNKEVIFSATGESVISVANNVLDARSWRSYADGEHGISKNPESYVKREGRKYFTDQQRGNIIQVGNDGLTTINQFGLEYETSNIMAQNKTASLVAAYDFKHKEYVVYIPSQNKCLAYKPTRNGFPNYFLFEPDFMINANNEFYAWKNGIMHKMNTTSVYNNFFGQQSLSKIKFFENAEPTTKKTWKNIALQSNKPWSAALQTNLTSNQILESDFYKFEDYFHAAIRGNTNSNTESNSTYGIGRYQIFNGTINATAGLPSTMSIGDTLFSASLIFAAVVITDIQSGVITTSNLLLNTVESFLMYSKNQTIDGQSIRGDILEVELTYQGNEFVELRAVDFEVAQSNY